MLKTMKGKILGAGVGLAIIGSGVGGIAMTGITSVGAQTSTPTATQSTPAPNGSDLPGAPDNAETTASDAAEPNDPQLPSGGHADPAGVDTQHEFTGIE